MDGPRPPEITEWPNILSFLNKSLRSINKWSIEQEYPLAFSQQNINNIRVIAANNQIVSHAVFRPVHLRTPYGLLKMATVGKIGRASCRERVSSPV